MIRLHSLRLHSLRLHRLSVLLLAALLAVACRDSSVSSYDDSHRTDRDENAVEQPIYDPGPAAGNVVAKASSGFTEKVKFKGKVEFAIKPMPDGAKLVDAAEKELARYTVKEALRIKVKDGSERELGQIKGSADKIHIEQPGDVRVFALQQQADGDYKLETAAGELLYKIKKRDYGWKLEDASGAEIAKVKTKSGKTSLLDASDAPILATKDSIRPLAMACLALDKIDQPLRVGLAIRMQAEGK